MLSRKLVLLGILVTACVGLAATGCGDKATITSPIVDEQSLPAPDGITATANVTTGDVTLSWLPLSSPTVAGYNIYKYDPIPTRESAYVKLNGAPVTGTSSLRDDFKVGGIFMIKAVSTTGKEGADSTTLHLAPYEGPPDQLRRG